MNIIVSINNLVEHNNNYTFHNFQKNILKQTHICYLGTKGQKKSVYYETYKSCSTWTTLFALVHIEILFSSIFFFPENNVDNIFQV